MIAALAAGVGTAAVIDIRTRRVPNWLTLLVALVGILLATTGVSGVSVGASLAGIAVGFLLMLPGHAFGGLGAGDVKLLAAVGALLGPWPIARAFLYTAIAGGALAIMVSWRRQLLKTTFDRAVAIVTSQGGTTAVDAPTARNRFPYAPAIALGTLIVAIGL